MSEEKSGIWMLNFGSFLGGENKSNPDFEDLDRVLLRSIIFSLEILKAEFILYLTIICQFIFLLLNIFYTR